MVVALAACRPEAAAPAPAYSPTAHPRLQVQEVDFLIGCWSARQQSDGAATRTLRLSPDATGDAITGAALLLNHGVAGHTVNLRFSRDGAAVQVQGRIGNPLAEQPIMSSDYARVLPAPEVTQAGAFRAPDEGLLSPQSQGARVATYVLDDGRWLVAERMGSRLSLYGLNHRGMPEDIFLGERDACDGA